MFLSSTWKLGRMQEVICRAATQTRDGTELTVSLKIKRQVQCSRLTTK
jgi:hypothetical protein